MNTINEAFLLLVVGMSTVFVILLFVIYMSRLLIVVVNRFAPEVNVVAKAQSTSSNAGTKSSANQVSSKQIAAITVALNLATEGKASILKIEKQ